MDFVRKKAFEAQLKKVTKSFKSSSDSHGTSPWSAFSSKSPAMPQDSDVRTKEVHIDMECAFDECPKNFPPLLNLCYIDKFILSDAAAAPVTWASRIFSCFVLLLVFNTVVAVLFTILDKGSGWLRLLISASATILLSIYQLIVYETAFRGAYRTSRNLRKRYLLFSVTNIPLISLYAFMGVTFFNGWMRMAQVATGENGTNFVLRRVLVILESVGWTILLFGNTYTIFEYYHLCIHEAQGLSPCALEAALKRNQDREKESRLERGRAEDAKHAKIQEIRDRYSIP